MACGARLCADTIRAFFSIKVPLGVLCIRAPYYIGDPKRDPNLENYPCGLRVLGYLTYVAGY